MSRMMPRSQVIFDKSNLVCSKTKECKNHYHTLKLKNSEVIIIKGFWIFCYMTLNSSWKINPNGPLMWTYMRSTQNLPKTLTKKLITWSKQAFKEAENKVLTWLMEPSSDIKWCEPRDHVVTQPTRKDTNSRKAK
jgi:hypothetical protein